MATFDLNRKQGNEMTVKMYNTSSYTKKFQTILKEQQKECCPGPWPVQGLSPGGREVERLGSDCWVSCRERCGSVILIKHCYDVIKI